MRAVTLLAAVDSILAFSVTSTRATSSPRSQQPTMRDFRIAPSILSADFARLGEEVENVLAAGADVVHFDVMDNHYVPNLTIGPMVCKALQSYGIEAPIDVHLMVTPVDAMIQDFAAAGADFITFHPEATVHVRLGLRHARQLTLLLCQHLERCPSLLAPQRGQPLPLASPEGLSGLSVPLT